MRYLLTILLTLQVTASNYYEVVYDEIRGGTSIFQVENYSDNNIYCKATGDNFLEKFKVYPQSNSRWYITPYNLRVHCD